MCCKGVQDGKDSITLLVHGKTAMTDKARGKFKPQIRHRYVNGIWVWYNLTALNSGVDVTLVRNGALGLEMDASPAI